MNSQLEKVPTTAGRVASFLARKAQTRRIVPPLAMKKLLMALLVAALTTAVAVVPASAHTEAGNGQSAPLGSAGETYTFSSEIQSITGNPIFGTPITYGGDPDRHSVTMYQNLTLRKGNSVEEHNVVYWGPGQNEFKRNGGVRFHGGSVRIMSFGDCIPEGSVDILLDDLAQFDCDWFKTENDLMRNLIQSSGGANGFDGWIMNLTADITDGGGRFKGAAGTFHVQLAATWDPENNPNLLDLEGTFRGQFRAER
jgi:hypothetical protein